MQYKQQEEDEPLQHWCDERDEVTSAEGPYWFGNAITKIEYSIKYKTWYANANNEYATVIRYCPFCGQDLWTERPE